jgi:hypothetical protein
VFIAIRAAGLVLLVLTSAGLSTPDGRREAAAGTP